MVDAFRKAALLKTNNEMLRSNSYANINAKYVFDDCGYEGQMTANNIIAYTINSDSETDSYEKMYIVHNTGDSEITVAGHEGWNILLGGTGVASSSVLFFHQQQHVANHCHTAHRLLFDTHH